MEKQPSVEDLILRYGKMKYSPGQICRLFGLNREETMILMGRLYDPDDPLRIQYEKGVAIGDYKRDRMLEKSGEKGEFMAISELSTRQYHRRQDELKKELFGI